MWTRAFLTAGIFLAWMISYEAQARIDNTASSLQKTKITLERGMCFGTCPIYKIEIYGSGRVVFSSDTRYPGSADKKLPLFAYPDGVLLPGVHEDIVDPNAVSDLINSFKRARFIDLRDQYLAQVTDMPQYRLTLQVGNRQKIVIDYVGQAAGMPKAVTQLENAVDKLAGTDRWVEGTPDLIPWLESQKFDFHSAQAGQLAAASANYGSNEDLAIGLIEKGAPLDASYGELKVSARDGEEPLKRSKVAQAVLGGAIAKGKLKLFNRIVKSDWFKWLDLDNAALVFAERDAVCSPQLVDAVAAAGIKIDATTPFDPENGLNHGRSTTALFTTLSTVGNCEGHEEYRLETARKLLAYGADPNHMNGDGETPIFSVRTVEGAKLLVEAGANLSAIDNDGVNALFSTFDDPVAMFLLEKGVSPAGKDKQCQTFLELAKERKLVKASKWVLMHPAVLKAPLRGQHPINERCKPLKSVY